MRCIYRVSKIAFETPCMLYIMQISPSYVKNKIVIFTKSHTVYEIKLKLNTLEVTRCCLEIWIRHYLRNEGIKCLNFLIN